MTKSTEIARTRDLTLVELAAASGGAIVVHEAAERGIIVQRGAPAGIWVQRGIIVQ